MEQGVAIMGSDVSRSEEFRDVESLAASQVRSLICVPVTVFHHSIGCIYLDSISAANRFNEDHLQLVAAIAGISAVALDNARRLQWLEQENQRLTVEVSQERSLVGESPRMKEVYQFLTRAAPAESTVLIEGESGTGKELAARALHRNSGRASKPFVAINCAAIPEALLESDLFGHERGAFTGATTQKKGRLEIANGGVVFLDEIGELAPALQGKTAAGAAGARVRARGGNASHQGRYSAGGGDKPRSGRGCGRGTISARPSLPARGGEDDYAFAARAQGRHSHADPAFCAEVRPALPVKAKPVSREAMACLVNYDWPGNVRELENAIERALVLGSSESVLPEDLPESLLERSPSPELTETKYHASVKELKKQLIVDAVEQTHGNYVEAAGVLGCIRTTCTG